MNKLYILILFCLSRCEAQAQIAFERLYASFYDLNPKWVYAYKQDYYVMSSYHFNYVALNKFDSVGNLIYTHDFGFVGTSFYKDGIRTQDRGFVIAGNTFGDPDNIDGESPYVIKLNEQGVQEWRKAYQLHAGGEIFDRGTSVVELSNGGYFLVSNYNQPLPNANGNLNKDIVLRKLDGQGNLIWAKLIGDSLKDNAETIIRTRGGEYLIGGYTEEFQNCGTPAYIPYIIKVDEEGEIIWEKRIDAQYFPCSKGQIEQLIEYETGKYIFNSIRDGLMTVVFDDWGNVLHIARDNGTIPADRFVLHPITGALYGYYRDYYDVRQFDSNLNEIGFWTYPNMRLRGMAITPQGEFLLTGVKNDSLCLLKTDCEGNIQNPVFCTTAITNPSAPTFTLAYTPDSWEVTCDNRVLSDTYTLSVWNALGQKMTTQSLNRPSNSVVNEGYTQGVYFLSITDASDRVVFTQKVVKF